LQNWRNDVNWRELQRKLNQLTEQELWDLIEAELAGKRRVTLIERMHMRAAALRTTRERLDLLKRATT
jgi:phosphoserine phosphatase